MENRLQFRHHTQIFETRQEAIDYIYTQIRYADTGMAATDRSQGFSLFAEPTILRYKNEEDETNPHVIVAIGAETNDGAVGYGDNRFCIIDIDNTEKEISEFNEALENAIKALTLKVFDTNTVALTSEMTESGTSLSADVKLAPATIFDDIRKPNSIIETEGGIFLYVNMKYDEENDTITFQVNGDVLDVRLSNSKLASGFYDKKDESLHLVSNDGSEVVVDCEELIAEWGVEGEASTTPIVLTREEIGYDNDEDHHHLEPWQDVLMADVRLKDEQKIVENGTVRYVKDPNSSNILNRASDGRSLYVDGKASSIIYYTNGEKTTVKAMLDKLGKIKLSPDHDNIVVERADGFFSSVKLDYLARENTLVLRASGQEDKRIQLNSVELFKDVYYDKTTEQLVMTYVDSNGEYRVVKVDLGAMLTDWEWEVQNDGHNVFLDKERHTTGNDKLSADVKLYDSDDNIIIDKNHSLYVKGVAENIKYGENSNVKEALDGISAATASEAAKLDAEIERSTAEDEKFDKIIGSGFTTDSHETVTYKFNELLDRLNSEIERAQNEENTLGESIASESVRATERENELESMISQKADQTALDSEIERATTKEAELEAMIGEKADQADLTAEVDRATQRENELEAMIGEKADQSALEAETERATTKEAELEAMIGEKADQAALDAEIARATAAEQALSDRISANTEQINALNEKDITNADSSIGIDRTNPSVPAIKVNLSTEIEDGRTNIIKLNSDGIYADVDLSYIKGENKLVFHTSDQAPDKVIELDSISTIIDIRYDPVTESLIIEYLANGSEHKTVTVPVRSLINEWRPSENTDGAIILRKERDADENQDVLSAEVIINTTHDDNAIVNDHGSLYVGAENIVQKSVSFQCLSAETKSIEGVLAVTGRCEDLIVYPGDRYSILSGATTFPEADLILEGAINNLQEQIDALDFDILGSETDTVIVSSYIDENNKRTIGADVKLQGGGDTVTVDNSNALGVVPDEGLYLSKTWDCGEYTEEESDDTIDDDAYMNYNRM